MLHVGICRTWRCDADGDEDLGVFMIILGFSRAQAANVAPSCGVCSGCGFGDPQRQYDLGCLEHRCSIPPGKGIFGRTESQLLGRAVAPPSCSGSATEMGPSSAFPAKSCRKGPRQNLFLHSLNQLLFPGQGLYRNRIFQISCETGA